MSSEDYSDWTKSDLQAELESRGVEAAGPNKDDLIAALEADDAGQTEEADGAPAEEPVAEEVVELPPPEDVDIANVDPGTGENEFFAPLNADDWVILDGAAEEVPDYLDGARAVILEAPAEPVPWEERGAQLITVRTRDEHNETLNIPFSAVKEVIKGGLSTGHRG